VVWLVGPLALIGCAVLFALLPTASKLVFFGWAAFGLLVYALYGYRRSAFATPQAKPPTLSPKLG
jgi:APA family basic amino acid/polyamine antiporter